VSDCPECDARLEATGGCRKCGWKPAEEPKAVKAPPAYQPFPERTWERSKPEDRCGEPGCTKTVREHQAELKAALRKIELKAISL
jgi:hypothetical protein